VWIDVANRAYLSVPAMRGVRILVWLAILGNAQSALALTFNVTFDPSTSSAPAGFFTALQLVTQFYQSQYTDPIVINVNVGWGEINGAPICCGFFGQSQTNGRGPFTYAQIRSALISDAKTADDATAVGSLPATDPTLGRNFYLSNAQAKALGLLQGNATGTDGWVGFSANVAWSFDPNNRAPSGMADFIAVAAHEITEVMGRYGFGQISVTGNSPIDLFRYSSAGVRDVSPAYSANNSTANYLSINGGQTNLHDFNVVCCGDLSDWASRVNDAFNAFGGAGTLPVSAEDRVEMDVLGYDRVQFTDDPLIASVTAVKAVHVTELRARIDAARAQHALGAYTYSQPSIAAGTTIVRAVDILEMRAALADVYTIAGAAPPTYTTSPAIGALIRTADVADLRSALLTIELSAP
jgi:hypothetical protein